MGQRQLLELARRYVAVRNRVGKAEGAEEKKRLLRTELFPLCALPRMVMFGENDAMKITANLTAFFAERFPTVFYEVHGSAYAPLSREVQFRFRRFNDDAAGKRVSVTGAEFLLFNEADRIRMIAYTEPVGDPEPGAEIAGP